MNTPADYIIEFVVVRNAMKVTAVDPVTLQEATVIGSAKLSRDMLARLAVKKLRFVIARKERASGGTA